MRIKLKCGITVDTKQFKYMGADVDRHGNVRVFVRRNGRKLRLRDWSSLEAFTVEYRKLLEAPTPVAIDKLEPAAPGTMRWLVERYYESGVYYMLENSTRAVRRRMLDAFCERHGNKPFLLIEPRHLAKIRDAKVREGAPEAANNLLKVLRAVFGWASDPEIGHVSNNPARDVKLVKTASLGHHAWTVDQVVQFEKRHPVGSKARLAMAIMLYTGVRASDAILLGRQMERDGWLHFTEFKNRKRNPKVRDIPILPELQTVIDATPSGNFNYLVTERDKPYATAKSFGNWFKRQCMMAGLPHCSAHGLRKAGAVIAAEHGATPHQLNAIYGWTTLKQAERYTRAASMKKLADESMHLVVPEQNMDESVPLSEAVETGGTNRGKKAC